MTSSTSFDFIDALAQVLARDRAIDALTARIAEVMLDRDEALRSLSTELDIARQVVATLVAERQQKHEDLIEVRCRLDESREEITRIGEILQSCNSVEDAAYLIVSERAVLTRRTSYLESRIAAIAALCSADPAQTTEEDLATIEHGIASRRAGMGEVNANLCELITEVGALRAEVPECKAIMEGARAKSHKVVEAADTWSISAYRAKEPK